ncbi:MULTISPECIES: zinc ribbon domain-containing protein [unclassified Methanoregula]|uniref:zinc ribbon domain-containing protein n=1 Tax=unclassified Methanoregula TaxID=2649730 RepID=UPI0009CAE98C|nr:MULTISPECIES: zinc ribbon domain-containing protein [unclassified Methanoregula]OPX64120.1 MAG: hypothetical protein A4E33_01143 [Methanoregula sp. PtaB.Bin085]OPY34760.1 MAG: hypothetical protein A4E34_01290 [Methanoregula sp. PtaU1.Bin006]
MTDKVQFTIKPELLAALGKVSGTTLSPVSPFRYGKEMDTAAATAQLAALGICDEKGTLAADKKEAVTMLAQAEAFTRIYLTTSSKVIEYIAYFGPGGKITGLTNDSGMQIITFPAPNDAMMELVRQTIGFSVYRTSPFTAQLTRAETLVFAAAVDLQRKEMLRKFADGKAADRLAISAKDIAGMLKTPPGNFQWLSSAFADLFTGVRIADETGVAPLFGSLAAKNLVTLSGKTASLSDESLLLARGHLLPSMYLTLTAGKAQPSGKTNAAGFSCIISGIHDLLSIEYNADEVELRSVASAEIHEYVKAFLTDPSLHAGMDTFSGAAGAAAGKKERHFCPQCGASLKPGLKFCSQCGAKIS